MQVVLFAIISTVIENVLYSEQKSPDPPKQLRLFSETEEQGLVSGF